MCEAKSSRLSGKSFWKTEQCQMLSGGGSTAKPSLEVKPAPALGTTILRTSLSRNDYLVFSYHPPDMQRSLDSFYSLLPHTGMQPGFLPVCVLTCRFCTRTNIICHFPGTLPGVFPAQSHEFLTTLSRGGSNRSPHFIELEVGVLRA